MAFDHDIHAITLRARQELVQKALIAAQKSHTHQKKIYLKFAFAVFVHLLPKTSVRRCGDMKVDTCIGKLETICIMAPYLA